MKKTAKGKNIRYFAVMLAMGILLVLLMLLNMTIGSVKVPFVDVKDAVLYGSSGNTAQDIVWKIRLPRMLAGILLGGGLALSGFMLQTFFNNPIAGPYVLGISSGAKLTVAIVMVSVLGTGRSISSAMLIVAAFAGALMSMGFVLLVSQRVYHTSMLVVSGVMIGYICSAITDIIVAFADDASIVNLHNWSRGSFSGIAWDDVAVMAVVITAAFAAAFVLSKPMGAYQLGESYAQNMGVNIKVFRFMLVLISSILSACVTAFAGPVSFVGIAVPHIVKSLLKTSKPILVIPGCFLGGAVFCLGCDLIARTVFAPGELSISSVTAVFGAPVVIAIMVKRRRES